MGAETRREVLLFGRRDREIAGQSEVSAAGVGLGFASTNETRTVEDAAKENNQPQSRALTTLRHVSATSTLIHLLPILRRA